MSDIEKGHSSGPGLGATSPHEALGNQNVLPASYAQATRPSRVGNPGALGLFSFASTTFILSLYNLQTRGITHANVVLGMAIFCGGLAQLLAGMWEFPRGNVFGGTAFTSYGAFWMSYAIILWPSSGVLTAFSDPAERASALGIFLITWFMVTFLLFIVSLRKSLSFILLFGFLTVTFALLAAGEFAEMTIVTKAGGGFGVITALIAYYIGLSELLAAEDMAVARLPLGAFPKRVD